MKEAGLVLVLSIMWLSMLSLSAQLADDEVQGCWKKIFTCIGNHSGLVSKEPRFNLSNPAFVASDFICCPLIRAATAQKRCFCSPDAPVFLKLIDGNLVDKGAMIFRPNITRVLSLCEILHDSFATFDDICRGVNGIASLITPEFFNSIIKQTKPSWRGKRFYTLDAFLIAVKSFPKFGDLSSSTGSSATLAAKREVAAFFAHITRETGQFCFKEELGAETKPYCDNTFSKYPCSKGKSYHGRGPIQITWNYNYGPCGKDLGLDLLNHPELVSSEAVVAFKSALWFWMKNVHHKMSNGFGSTIRAINSGECKGKKPKAVAERIMYYTRYCQMFGITPGPNLSC